MATRLGLKSVVESLLESGANINSTNDDNDTALIWATVNKNKGIVELLLKYNPNLNSIDNDKRSALMYASNRHQSKDIVELLVNAGADINQTFIRIEKVQHYDAWGDKRVGQFDKKNFNRTSFTLAKENKYKSINGIEEFLKTKGAIVTS